jgi:hypothetical protein
MDKICPKVNWSTLQLDTRLSSNPRAGAVASDHVVRSKLMLIPVFIDANRYYSIVILGMR